MTEWKMICHAEDIPVLGVRRVARPQGLDVAVFRNETNSMFAMLERCTHNGGPLSQGIVFGTHVAGPTHNGTIGLCDGQASAPVEGSPPQFAFKVEQGAVYLDTAELATMATDLTRPTAGPALRCAGA